MALIVQKYGGAVLSNIAKIRQIADHIADLHASGNQVVVVVSAMGYTTDDLVRLAYSVAREPAKREMDMLLSVGERIAMSLMAMAIEDTGRAKAISFTGSQVGIITDTKHTEARIVEIRTQRLREALDDGRVVVIAGFQGVSLDREITTLGRGGSDTTAVAIAAALGADRCDLVKEVPGIFSGDPTIIPEAIPIPEMDYASVKGLSLGGARILNKYCLEIAQRYGIELRVGSPYKTTLINERTQKPFISVTLSEGFILLRGRHIPNILTPANDFEMAEIDGDKICLCRDSALEAVNTEVDFSAVVEGLSRMTAVGDGVHKICDLVEADEGVVKVYYKSSFYRETRVYFKSKDPVRTLHRVHNILIMEKDENSDGGQ
ncbi:MAG: aspartate kinase [candidate division Zixibacteria bacterium]|nr:aspartate kinase [Candidatus Tariuqbacter arcticus]